LKSSSFNNGRIDFKYLTIVELNSGIGKRGRPDWNLFVSVTLLGTYHLIAGVTDGTPLVLLSEIITRISVEHFMIYSSCPFEVEGAEEAAAAEAASNWRRNLAANSGST
jgi:hypothetical protein